MSSTESMEFVLFSSTFTHSCKDMKKFGLSCIVC